MRVHVTWKELSKLVDARGHRSWWNDRPDAELEAVLGYEAVRVIRARGGTPELVPHPDGALLPPRIEE